MLKYCPGASNIRGAPTIKIKICPQCGGEVEVFSSDLEVECKCGFKVYNDIQSCIKWCPFASECIGEETYKQLSGKNK